MKEATPTVFIDNERVRVTEWRFAPGAATGWHRHEYDYVVVNDDFDETAARVRVILDAERLRRERQTGLVDFVKGLA